MRTVSVFRNGSNQAIRLPKDMEFKGVQQLEIIQQGDTIILRPLRPSWLTLNESEKADMDFLQDRVDIIDDENRFAP